VTARAGSAGAVTLSTQMVDNTGHRLSDGFLRQDGKSRSARAGLDVDCAVTDRLAVLVGLPDVAAKFLGRIHRCSCVALSTSAAAGTVTDSTRARRFATGC
jgi:hypothetical protein